MSRRVVSQADAYVAAWGPKGAELAELTDLSQLAFLAAGSPYVPDDWTFVGKATISVEMVSMAEIVEGQLAGLRAQLEAVRAENQQRENLIQDQISKLLALPCEVAL